MFPLSCRSLLGLNCKQGCVFQGTRFLLLVPLALVGGIPTVISQEEIGYMLWSNDMRKLFDLNGLQIYANNIH